jgi:hypothetical protein
LRELVEVGCIGDDGGVLAEEVEAVDFGQNAIPPQPGSAGKGGRRN